MKSTFKKIGALVLALVMVLSLSVVAFADGEATLTGGEVGGSSTFATDNPTSQSKAIKIAKELTVYNVDVATIKAPTITYNYTVTAGGAVSITDATTDHANSTAVTVTTKPGNLTGLKVNGTAGATGSIAWASTEDVSAGTDGVANLKYLTLDFADVVFGAAGVYRYVITETAPDYAASGVTETTNTTNAHVRYLDVYVRPATSGFTDGTAAADWDVYGYVCVLENEDITDAGDTATTGAVKTNGFVAGSNDSTAYLADSYYTYNVTVSKTVTNDAYAQATHAFPFTVLFTNAAITQTVDIMATSTGTAGGFTDPAAAALSASTTNGILTLKHNSSVKYIGIPNGTQIEVYETNDVTGVTYQVTTTTDGATPAQVDAAVISGTAPASAVTQTTKANYESTKTTITPTANADDNVAHTIAIDNNLQVISPTGVVLRIAPYALMLGAGLFLVLFTRRRKEENEA